MAVLGNDACVTDAFLLDLQQQVTMPRWESYHNAS
jgi:hypothetical protein